MFLKDILGISISSSHIKLLVGNSLRIKVSGVIPTPEGSFLEDKIIDVDLLHSAIAEFIRSKNIKVKSVAFAVKGQDISVRNIETPIMNDSSIRNAVKWEVNQYLPSDGDNHYIDFEVLEKVKESDKKYYKVLTAAVPKEKIEKYVELAEKLNLNLGAIDISANCIARVFKKKGKNKAAESTGIIEIEEKSSRIIILNKGKLFMEREVPFGVENVTREIGKKLNLTDEGQCMDVLQEFNFNFIKEEDELHKRIQTLFDNVLSSFNKVIQFYTTGKVSKKLDEIYVVGTGSRLNGLDGYVADYFEASDNKLSKDNKINIRFKIPRDCDLSLCIDVLGLLLRKE